MKILGIDYGRSKVGLAISEGKLAEPMKVIRYKDSDSTKGRKILSEQIKRIIEQNKIERVVVGISEGEIAEESKKFASELTVHGSRFTVDLFDETLSTNDAQELSRQAGMKRKKRKEMEDAYAATIMLQNYLDRNSVLS